MTLITNGIREVKDALVDFAKFVGKSAEGLWKAASKGVSEIVPAAACF